MKNFKIFITLIILITTISGCNNSEDIDNISSEGPSHVFLSITKNYGKEEIFNEKVELKNNFTVYDVLNENIELGTEYGGGFVSSIEGIESTFGGSTGVKKDWFYYINGICADVGAIDYELTGGEQIWWDYHKWDGATSANSSVVGMYSEPFINGYRNKTKSVKILYAGEDIKESEELKNSLLDLGTEKVAIMKAEEELIKNRESPTIVIGQWEEIKEIKYIKDLNENNKKTGTYSLYSDSSLKLMDYNYETVETLNKNYSTINSYGQGLGDENPLWIISGKDAESISRAVKLMVESPEKLHFAYGLALVEEEVIKLPME